jgi:hypothetical protein
MLEVDPTYTVPLSNDIADTIESFKILSTLNIDQLKKVKKEVDNPRKWDEMWGKFKNMAAMPLKESVMIAFIREINVQIKNKTANTTISQ